MRRVLLACLGCFLFGQCGFSPAAELMMPLSTVDQAVANREIGRAEALFESEEDDVELTALVDKLSSYEVFEAPGYYQAYFFRSYLEFKKRRFDAAVKLLSQFKCMLTIESGVDNCSILNRSGPYKLCAETMCAEIYQSYYEQPTRETLAWVDRYWGYVQKLETKLGGPVASCAGRRGE